MATHVFCKLALAAMVIVGSSCRDIEPTPPEGVLDLDQVYQSYDLKTTYSQRLKSSSHTAYASFWYGGPSGAPYYPGQSEVTFNAHKMVLGFDENVGISRYGHTATDAVGAAATFAWNRLGAAMYTNRFELDTALVADADFTNVSRSVELIFVLTGSVLKSTSSYAMAVQGVSVTNAEFANKKDGSVRVTVPQNVMSTFAGGYPLGVTIVIANSRGLVQGTAAGGAFTHEHTEHLYIPKLTD